MRAIRDSGAVHRLFGADRAQAARSSRASRELVLARRSTFIRFGDETIYGALARGLANVLVLDQVGYVRNATVSKGGAETALATLVVTMSTLFAMNADDPANECGAIAIDPFTPPRQTFPQIQ